MFLWFFKKFMPEKGTTEHKEVSQTSNEDVVQSTSNDDQNNVSKERGSLSSYIDRSEKRCPRTWNIVTMIIIPLLFLICLSMLCGHFLAVLESENEIDSLNSSMENFMSDTGGISNAVEKVQSAYDKCLVQYIANNVGQPINGVEIINFMDECKASELEEVSAIVKEREEKTEGNLIQDMSFNWNRCFEDKEDLDGAKSYNTQLEQASHFFSSWIETFLSEYDNNNDEEQKVNDEQMVYKAAINKANEATKHSCTVNSAGGAMFWFTIMTTIGYGNTAPGTSSGRILVYTMGFISILAFTACIGTASYVFLTIADDFFANVIKIKRLTKGFLSVILWFCMFVAWILVLVGVYALYAKERYGDVGDPFIDRLWWAFISVTTVGFGDFHIPHETFQLRDMLYIPLLLLVGFVLLANFLLKLSKIIFSSVKKIGLTDDESLNYLIKQDRASEEEMGNKDSRIDQGGDLCSFVPDILMIGTESEEKATGLSADDDRFKEQSNNKHSSQITATA